MGTHVEWLYGTAEVLRSGTGSHHSVCFERDLCMDLRAGACVGCMLSHSTTFTHAAQRCKVKDLSALVECAKCNQCACLKHLPRDQHVCALAHGTVGPTAYSAWHSVQSKPTRQASTEESSGRKISVARALFVPTMNSTRTAARFSPPRRDHDQPPPTCIHTEPTQWESHARDYACGKPGWEHTVATRAGVVHVWRIRDMEIAVVKQ